MHKVDFMISLSLCQYGSGRGERARWISWDYLGFGGHLLWEQETIKYAFCDKLVVLSPDSLLVYLQGEVGMVGGNSTEKEMQKWAQAGCICELCWWESWRSETPLRISEQSCLSWHFSKRTYFSQIRRFLWFISWIVKPVKHSVSSWVDLWSLWP